MSTLFCALANDLEKSIVLAHFDFFNGQDHDGIWPLSNHNKLWVLYLDCTRRCLPPDLDIDEDIVYFCWHVICDRRYSKSRKLCRGHSTSLCVSHQTILIESLCGAAEAGRMTGRKDFCVIVNMMAWVFSSVYCDVYVVNSWYVAHMYVAVYSTPWSDYSQHVSSW